MFMEFCCLGGDADFRCRLNQSRTTGVDMLKVGLSRYFVPDRILFVKPNGTNRDRIIPRQFERSRPNQAGKSGVKVSWRIRWEPLMPWIARQCLFCCSMPAVMVLHCYVPFDAGN